jgi:trk system potassium uptake protein TrkA
VLQTLVVIVGGGRLGSQLASDLLSDGHDVSLIEQDEELCKELALQVDAMVICGNGTDRKTLESAQIEEADVLMAATGNDNVNLMTCLLARDYKPKKIIARVNDPQHEEVFLANDLVETVRPECTEAGYLEKLILKPKIADLYVVYHGKAEMLEIYVKNKNLVGKTIRELSPTEDYIICGVYENGNEKISIAKPDMILREDDKISVLVKKDSMKKVLKIFTP